MKKVIAFATLLLLSSPLLWAEHFRFSRFYGPGSSHHRYLGGHRYSGLSSFGHGFYRGYGFRSGYYNRGFLGNRYYDYGYPPFGYSYNTRGYPARYYRNYDTRGTYLVYLGPSNAAEVVRANYSDLIFNVTPKTASVYVDGSLIGSARSFSTHRDRFPIVEGEHHLRIEYPGFEPFETTLQVVPDRNLHIDVELKPQP